MSSLLIALLLLLLLASAFFSGTETAFFSLTRVHLRRLEREGKGRSRRVLDAMARSQELLNTVLVGNNLVNIAFSVVATSLFLQHFGEGAVELSIAASTLAVLLVGEVTPKMLAMTYPETLSRWLVDPYRVVRTILAPLTAAVGWLANLCLRAFGLRQISGGPSVLLTRAELGSLLEGADEEGVMTARESRLVQRILEFSSTRVGEIMTPRVDMVAAPVDLDRTRLEALVTRARHSRIPVYERTIDEVVGCLKVRDFLLDPDRRLATLILPMPVVPERAPASKVFYELQRRRSSMAVVVNEYGETVGLVTREDLIEEVVGEIFDEFEAGGTEIRREGAGVWIAEGRARLEELNDALELDLPVDEAVTLNGFLAGLHGGLPRRGDRIAWDGVTFEVLEIARHRIQRCRVELPGGTAGRGGRE